MRSPTASSVVALALLGLALGSGPAQAAVQKLYWPDTSFEKIQRANPDGSNVEDLILASAPGGVAIDPVGGRIYWTRQVVSPSIHRANLDGSNEEVIVSGAVDAGGFPYHIALDLAGGWVYWTALSDGIYRARLDGSGHERIFGPWRAKGLALDLVHRHVYWGTDTQREVRRVDLDGSNPTLVFQDSTSAQVEGLALDVAGGRIYFADAVQGIRRVNFNGSGVTTLVGGTSEANGVDLDLAGGKLYWTDVDLDHIRRADLDGQNVETLVTGLSFPRDVALDPPESSARRISYSIVQATTSALPGGYPSSPPISLDLHPPDPIAPPVLSLSGVIALATANCGTPAQVASSMTASAPDPDAERALLEIEAATPPNPCTDSLELSFDLFPPDPIAPDPALSIGLVDLAPGGERFDVFVTLTHASGAVQELRFGGRVGPSQPAGAVSITGVTATPGSLDLGVQLTTTASFDPNEVALAIDLSGAVAAAGVAVPALGPLPRAIAALLVLAGAGLGLRRRRRPGRAHPGGSAV